MCQHDRCNRSRLNVLSGNAEVSAAFSVRFVVDIQNELLLKFHQRDRLNNLRALWDQAELLNKCANLLAACHNMHSIIDFAAI